MNDKTLGMIGGLMLAALLIGFFYMLSQFLPPADGKTTVTVNLDHTVCYPFEGLEMGGWKRVPKSQRHVISEMAARGELDVMEAETLECADVSAEHINWVKMREHWFKWRPKS